MKKFMTLSWKAKLLIIVVVALIIAGAIFKFANGSIELTFGDKETTCQKAVTKWETENPSLTKEKALFTGVPAPINFNSTRFPDAKKFKSAIIAAVNDGPDLAGKYAVAQWGCGTACQNHAVVNMETGEIVAYGIPSEAGISMSDKYNVLITNPRENLPKQADLAKAKPASLEYLLNIARQYYVLDDSGATTTLHNICTENPFEGMTI